MRTLLLMCSLVMACGGEAGQGPAPTDEGDAATVDVGPEAPPGVTSECGVSRLDCDGNGSCETLRDDANCRGCRLACAAGQTCIGGDCLR